MHYYLVYNWLAELISHLMLLWMHDNLIPNLLRIVQNFVLLVFINIWHVLILLPWIRIPHFM